MCWARASAGARGTSSTVFSPPGTSLVWSDELRGVYKQSEYGRVILPLVVLRRLDCVLEPTKADVLARHGH